MKVEGCCTPFCSWFKGYFCKPKQKKVTIVAQEALNRPRLLKPSHRNLKSTDWVSLRTVFKQSREP